MPKELDHELMNKILLESRQIAQLNEDIERAHGSGSAVPPGVHAHLGYMLYLEQLKTRFR